MPRRGRFAGCRFRRDRGRLRHLSAGRGRHLDADGVCGDIDCNSADAGAFAPPTDVTDVQATQIAGGHRFTWTDQSSTAGTGTTYDVYSGLLSDVNSVGDFSQGTCAAENAGVPVFDHLGPDPGVGETMYFLIRAQNGCPGGTSSFGNALRDTSAGASLGACM